MEFSKVPLCSWLHTSSTIKSLLLNIVQSNKEFTTTPINKIETTIYSKKKGKNDQQWLIKCSTSIRQGNIRKKVRQKVIHEVRQKAVHSNAGCRIRKKKNSQKRFLRYFALKIKVFRSKSLQFLHFLHSTAERKKK